MKNRLFTKAISAAICLPLAMTVFVGCSDDDVNNNSSQNGEDNQSKDVIGGERLTIASLTQEKKSNISARTNGFSWKMLSEVAKKRGNAENTFLSPLSLAIDLGMLQNGANGDTYTEIVNSIGLQDFSSSEVNAYFSNVISDLQKADPTVDLNVANIIYFNNTMVNALNPDFTKFITSSYEAPVKGGAMDQSTVDEVNQWCNEQTKGTIPSIIDKFDSNCIIALLNAIYLKGDFTTKLTSTFGKGFKNGNGEEVFQDRIAALRNMSYFEDSKLQYCEIPLGNKAFNVFFALPKEGDVVGTSDYLASNWSNMIKNLSDTLVSFSAPRFKTELEIKGDDMKEVMGTLGMTTMFDEEKADLKECLTPTDFFPYTPILNLYVGNVAQKTHFEISTDGVKASAVTIIEVIAKMSSAGPVETPEFVVMDVDHPFAFGIREASTGAILFNGICNDPTLMKIDE